MRVLVVKSSFRGYSRGVRITDPEEIEKVLSGPERVHVVASDHEADETPAVSDEPQDEFAH